MSNRVPPVAESTPRLARRHAADFRFRLYGVVSIGLALAALILLLGGIAVRGISSFQAFQLHLALDLDAEVLGLGASGRPFSEAEISDANYTAAIRARLRELAPEAQSRTEKRALYALVTRASGSLLRERVVASPALIGTRVEIALPLDDAAQLYLQGDGSRDLEESRRKLQDAQLDWLDAWAAEGRLEKYFDLAFLTSGDSREPELAGLGGAFLGSMWTLLVTLALSFPLGVAAAVHLEEFAKKGPLTDFIEVNINNLAAVPSIVFGLLGLAVFLNFFGLPRSAPVVGGLVLALMTLPTIIIAARSAMRAVPPSIREAAMAIGASPLQVVGHHVIPLALPGIMTGTIIGMARALGETAPLLMIGMVAFIADLPEGPLAPATVLPVQVYLWAESPERAFVAKTAGAILVLIGVLLTMNSAAIVLRRRSERRW